jgi:plasmid maintenance system antidote protein VapI
MKKLPNIHPGFFLKEELLKPMKISQYRLAKGVKVSRDRDQRDRA